MATQIVFDGEAAAGFDPQVSGPFDPEIQVASGGAAAYTLNAGSGSYTLTGAATKLSLARHATAAPGAYTLTGAAATLRLGHPVTASPGSYTLSGVATTLKLARLVAASPGSYALTGSPATLAVGRKATAAPGSFTITGAPATFKAGWKAIASPGSYGLTGAAATLIYTPGGGGAVNYTFNAASGQYGLTGLPVGLALYTGWDTRQGMAGRFRPLQNGETTPAPAELSFVAARVAAAGVVAHAEILLPVVAPPKGARIVRLDGVVTPAARRLQVVAAPVGGYGHAEALVDAWGAEFDAAPARAAVTAFVVPAEMRAESPHRWVYAVGERNPTDEEIATFVMIGRKSVAYT